MPAEEYINILTACYSQTSCLIFTVGFRLCALSLHNRTRVAITGLFPRDVSFTPPPSFLQVGPSRDPRLAADAHGPRCWGTQHLCIRQNAASVKPSFRLSLLLADRVPVFCVCYHPLRYQHSFVHHDLTAHTLYILCSFRLRFLFAFPHTPRGS